MATEIRNIPVLTDAQAAAFVDKAEHAVKHEKGSIDFTKQVAIGKQILEKAKIDKP